MNGGTKSGVSTISLGRLQCVRWDFAGPIDSRIRKEEEEEERKKYDRASYKIDLKKKKSRFSNFTFSTLCFSL
jgi:hypothetical protein